MRQYSMQFWSNNGCFFYPIKAGEGPFRNVVPSHKRGEGVWKNIEISKHSKLYFYVYYMLMVTEYLIICPVIHVICLKSLEQDVDLDQTEFTSMIVNVFLSRKRGEGGHQKVMRRDLISGKR